MYRHYRKIAENVDLPMILYNVPGRTVADLTNDTVMRLSQIPGIVGLKDATGDVGRGISLMRELPPEFAVYSGDDDTAAALILLGAQGNISVTANIVPRLMKKLCTAALADDAALVRTISRQVAPLNRALFLESNPIPVKWALAQMGRISPTYRLPLTELMPAYHAELCEAMRLAGAELVN
jgi:4-hydroxy-tetrahydrodipicolinate synthase